MNGGDHLRNMRQVGQDRSITLFGPACALAPSIAMSFHRALPTEEEGLSPRAFSFVGCATNKRSLRKDLNREGPKARDSSAKDRSRTVGDLNGKVAFDAKRSRFWLAAVRIRLATFDPG